jgi:hypothetical protein
MALVCDAAALLELARRALLRALPRLPFAVTVADVLHADPRFDLDGLHWAQLRRLGLRVQALDAEGVALAIACLADWPMLSSHDCFSVALARQRHWPLLTHNGCVAAAAAMHGVVVRDLRWLDSHLAALPPDSWGQQAAPGTRSPALRCNWRRSSEADCRFRCTACPSLTGAEAG